MGGHAASKFDIDEARRLYEAGFSCRQVGERLGVSYSRVAECLRRAGVTMRPVGRRSAKRARPVNLDRLVRLRAQGLTYPQLAERFGVTTDIVRDRYLAATGQPRRQIRADAPDGATGSTA